VVADDDLSAPLGQHKTQPPRAAAPIALRHVVAGVLSLVLIAIAGWAMIADDSFGGEPMVIVPAHLRGDTAIKKPEEMNSQAAAPDTTEGSSRDEREAIAPAVPPGSRTITIIDGMSGKRQDVVIPPSPESKSASLDERLTESSRHGLLPKVAADGARAANAYASPVKSIPGKPNAPRVAIVIGGLGIGTAVTDDAIGKLPGPVTLAFAPYGGGLGSQVARAREGGHEVLLQVPMEPFDYPDNDPGPQTLLTSLDAAQNVDRLHWLMSRFQGYVGIANAMGGRFTSSEQALAPVLRETAKRGLIYLDDGSSARGLASQIAGANNLAFAKADLVIDAVPASADVDRALGRLEAMARERGVAVGVASALPVSIERIARWTKAAESRGVLLVPITAVVAKAKSS
jgi:uncharacterized protein